MQGSPASGAGVPGLLIAVLAAVLLSVLAVVLVVVSESELVRAAAVVLVALGSLALVMYVYAMATRAGIAEPKGGAGAASLSAAQLGADVGAGRLRAALVTALRDAHALQRGSAHFAAAAASSLRGSTEPAGVAAGLVDLFETQRDQAGRHEALLGDHLHALGARASRGTDDEAIIAARLYERLLVRGVATNARHAFGLLALNTATYRLIEHLAAAAGDEAGRELAVRCRRDVDPLAERWPAAWEQVLDADIDGVPDGARRTMLVLLDEARDTEAIRASLLRVTAAQARQAGAAPGTEDAGLARLVAHVDQQRSEAESGRDLLDERIRALDHHPPRLHTFETTAAARAAALVEHVREYKVVRDVRDLLAAERLETATYTLLAGAADRAGDAETAALAQRLGAREHVGSERLSAELDSALEVALLAE